MTQRTCPLPDLTPEDYAEAELTLVADPRPDRSGVRIAGLKRSGSHPSGPRRRPSQRALDGAFYRVWEE